jgi:predicted phage-related endonuclease
MLLEFKSEQEWLSARSLDVTSTEISSLFGLSPYKSRLKLWHIKKGNIEDDFQETDATAWGKWLEVSVALKICNDQGWIGEHLKLKYSTFPDLRLGSSYDVKINCLDRGNGHLEIKVAESFDEAQGWFPDKAPIGYEFQMQNQLHCLLKDGQDIKFNCLGTLGRRQKTRLYFREYDAELGQMIDHEVKEFWASINADIPPPPDYCVDGEILEKLRKPLRSGDVVNFVGNTRAAELATEYARLKECRDGYMLHVKEFERGRAPIKAELHDMMGRNERAIIGDYQIGAKVQTNEETGSSFRRFDFSKRRK